MGGGCSAPVGVESHVNLEQNFIKLNGAVWSLNGKQVVDCTLYSKLADKTVIQSHIDQYRSENEEPPKKCPYKQPRQFVGVTPGKFSYLDLDMALKLGLDVADSLLKKGAAHIMNAAKETIHSAIN